MLIVLVPPNGHGQRVCKPWNQTHMSSPDNCKALNLHKVVKATDILENFHSKHNKFQ